jgi:hypothetical protein
MATSEEEQAVWVLMHGPARQSGCSVFFSFFQIQKLVAHELAKIP